MRKTRRERVRMSEKIYVMEEVAGDDEEYDEYKPTDDENYAFLIDENL